MYRYKRLLVGLDLTEMDDKILAYTAMIVKLFGSDKAYFIHVAKTLDLPDEIREKYPDLLAPVDESIEKSISDKVGAYFDGIPDFHYEVEAKEGNPSEKILRWSKVKDIDLLVMGRKKTLRGSGVLPGKLAKVAPCSILFVPENAQLSIKKAMVPVDFSKTSEIALEKALYLTQANQTQVIMQHAYVVPSGYHKTGKSYEDFAEIMASHAKNDCQKFVGQIAIEGIQNVRCVYNLDDDRDPSDKAYATAKAEGVDFIIIGSKGRTNAASLLLGSTADKMTVQINDIPLLVVKEKKENLGFLEAIFRL